MELEVEKYLSELNEMRYDKIFRIINYIKTNYSKASESCDYAPKTKFPIYRYNGTYVAVASMKSYITIHFGSYNVAEIIKKANSKVVTKVGCVNIKDNLDFPYDAIYKAIDLCFKGE